MRIYFPAAMIGLIFGSVGCSNRCPQSAYPYLEVGVGTRDFIYVPYDQPVSPDSPLGATEPYYNVALAGYGLDRTGLRVHLQAFVGERRYAESSHDDVGMRCRTGRQLEVGGLRLPLDPQDLPPAEVVSPIVDTARELADSGYYEPAQVQGDVRVEATVTERSGRVTTAEAFWFVYR